MSPYHSSTQYFTLHAYFLRGKETLLRMHDLKQRYTHAHSSLTATKIGRRIRFLGTECFNFRIYTIAVLQYQIFRGSIKWMKSSWNVSNWKSRKGEIITSENGFPFSGFLDLKEGYNRSSFSAFHDELIQWKQ